MEGKLLKTRTNRLLVNPVNGKYKMKPDKNYFRLKFVGEGTGTFHIDLLTFLEYSYDCNNWSTLNTTGGTDFTVSKGTVIFIRCIMRSHRLDSAVNNNTNYSSTISFFTDTDSIDYIAEGNVASLLYTDFEGKTLVPPVSSGNNGYRGLYNLFYNCKHLVYAYDLILPFTDLVDYVYDSYVHPTQNNRGYCRMFYGCTNLTHAPKELPATILGTYCYSGMFDECKSLTHAPKELPALTITAENAYSYMFRNCTSLVTAPEIKATSVTGRYAFQLMFCGCSNLKNVLKVLYPLELSYNCCNRMFLECTSLVSAPEILANTIGEYCFQYMFNGCTSLVKCTTSLNFDTAYLYCCNYMFQNCTSLVSAPELKATTVGTGCYASMFSGCTSLTNTQIYLPAEMITMYSYDLMFRGCTSLERGPSLYFVKQISDNYACRLMFYGCSKLKYFGSPGLENVQRIGTENVKVTGNSALYLMFYNCKSLERAPILSATTIKSTTYAYNYMFYGCSSLNYIRTRYLGDTFDSNVHSNWVYGVSKTGTFVKSPNATWTNSYGSSAIPSGWTVVIEIG